MTPAIRFLNEMFRMRGDHIDKPLEQYLLAMYEEEPFPYEWSEQDLYEQIRKLILQENIGDSHLTFGVVMFNNRVQQIAGLFHL